MRSDDISITDNNNSRQITTVANVRFWVSPRLTDTHKSNPFTGLSIALGRSRKKLFSTADHNALVSLYDASQRGIARNSRC